MVIETTFRTPPKCEDEITLRIVIEPRRRPHDPLTYDPPTRPPGPVAVTYFVNGIEVAPGDYDRIERLAVHGAELFP